MLKRLFTRRRRRQAPRNPSGLEHRVPYEPKPMPRMRWY